MGCQIHGRGGGNGDSQPGVGPEDGRTGIVVAAEQDGRHILADARIMEELIEAAGNNPAPAG